MTNLELQRVRDWLRQYGQEGVVIAATDHMRQWHMRIGATTVHDLCAALDSAQVQTEHVGGFDRNVREDGRPDEQ